MDNATLVASGKACYQVNIGTKKKPQIVISQSGARTKTKTNQEFKTPTLFPQHGKVTLKAELRQQDL